MDEDVEPAELRLGLLHRGAGGLGVAQVGLDVLAGLHVDHRHRGAVLAERVGDRGAEAPGAAGDDDALILQPEPAHVARVYSVQ